MEEETHATSGEVQEKLANKVDIAVDGDDREVLINGDSHRQRKEGNKEEYEDETAFDGEFIKIEKESIDVKESSQVHKPTSEVEEASSATKLDSRNSVTDTHVSEMEETIKALQLQVETVAKELQQSESEKAMLKSEFDIANVKLEKMERHCEELEVERKHMKEQILETEQKYSLQLQSLHEELRTLNVNHKELVDVKEAFNQLSTEMESSRKRMEELEAQLASSAGEARKFEELSNERSSHAELESKRALEFEKMLELAKLSAKEMEEQMGNLQEELKGLDNKIAENQQIEETLSRTTLELSEVKEKFDLSKAQLMDLEQKFVSQEAIVQELNQELNLHKTSKEQMRDDVCALEELLSATKEDLQAKVANLEAVESKLQEEIKAQETIEASLKSQEMQALSLQEELKKLIGEKEILQSTVVDLDANLSLTKDLCNELESKLNLADQEINRTDSLLSQTMSHNEELAQKLKSLEELHHESRTVVETSSQRNLELEGLVQASNLSEESVKAQLRDTEMRLISVEKQNMELEQQLTLAALKGADADREIKEFHQKTTELITLLKSIEEENKLSKGQLQAYEDRISQLESSLSDTCSRNSELEQELKDIKEKCAEHEGRASATHQRSLELEDLVHLSHSKAEDSGKRVGELEILLEAANYRSQELEQLLSNVEAKYRDVEAESKQHNSRVSELSAELEAFQTKSSNLEAVLQAANEKERELTDTLNIVTEERKKFEGMSNASGEKILQSENLIEVLQIELKSKLEKLENVEKDLGASGVRESEILEKLKSAEQQLEQHERVVEQANARILELETLHESSIKDSELKLQEASVSFTQKDSEAKQLHEKLKSLEEQTAFYQDQSTEATEKVASLKAELEASTMKMVSLENIIEELKRKISETETKAEQSISDNELLSGTNLKLQAELVAHQSKVNELHELLSSVQAEKEVTAEKLASHVNTIEKLTDEHSRGLELQSETESRIKETAVQLQEAIERFTRRDSEARDLNEKLLTLETQLKSYEEQASEVTSISENRKFELEEALLKVQKLEGFVEELRSKVTQFESENESLARTNLSLSQDLAAYETKMSELQVELSALIAEKEANSRLREELVTHQSKVNELHELLSSIQVEKEATAEQLTFHVNTIANLTDEHSRGLELQSATESRIKETEIQLHEAIERFTRRDSEARDLNEKLLALETQLRSYEEQVSEVTGVAESRKVELEETRLKIQKLEGFVEELQSKVSQFETENKSLARANLGLSEDLAEFETKMNELQVALNAVIAEKEDTSLQLHGSRKTIEDLMQQVASEGEKLQSQITSVMEENNMLNQIYQDAKKELQTVMVQMEELTTEQKAREISLNADADYLKVELGDKSLLQAQISELKEQLVLAETKYTEEIESLQSASAGKETILTSKLEEHTKILHERDVLDEKLKELQKELKLAHSTLEEQKELVLSKELEMEATVKQSLADVETEHQRATHLEKQVEETRQKLQIAEKQYMEKGMEEGKKLAVVNAELEDLKTKLGQTVELERKIAELENELKLMNTKSREQVKDGIMEADTKKDGVEVKSRDFELGTSTVSKRKSKKRSEGAYQTAGTTSNPAVTAVTAATAEPSGPMAFKFILGVALVSIIIGIILGKRY